MTYVGDLGERLENDLDRWGWAETDEERAKAIRRWAEHVSSALVSLANRSDAADELEAKLIERGML